MSFLRTRNTRVAALQMRITPGEPDENLKCAAGLLSTAAQRKAELACLPANFATGLNFPTLRRDATPADGPVVEFLVDQARGLGIHIAAGVLLAEGREVYDAAVLVGPSGEVLSWYRRPCVWAGEADHITPGAPGEVVDTPVGRIGLLVGYDLRFPEASRQYLLQEVDVIVCVATLFAPFSHQVRSICRARAADAECALVLASGAGENRFAMMPYLGRSMIVNGLVQDAAQPPDADVLAEVERGAREAVIEADIPLRTQRKVRERLPFHDDLRSTWTTGYGGRS
ncbi:carbon-nitrogen hydrolase family protein [Kitasatospora sp. NPDC059827]|uniref:carbon-nitrogen hydrolase family protein n=1 Tax=Kitasatospora sp. NPDC059827 TaxID=3346964 RepID=UPI00365C2B1C